MYVCLQPETVLLEHRLLATMSRLLRYKYMFCSDVGVATHTVPLCLLSLLPCYLSSAHITVLYVSVSHTDTMSYLSVEVCVCVCSCCYQLYAFINADVHPPRHEQPSVETATSSQKSFPRQLLETKMSALI